MHLNDLLKNAVTSGASDLHLKVGSYPMMRVNGVLVVASEEKRLDRADTETIASGLFTPDLQERFKRAQEVDLAYSVPGLGRFRCNVFQQRGTVGLVLRVIPTKILSIEELGLPPVLRKIADEERGLVLVTGTTGSGKSTTLAAMIDHINARRACHIMTVEDPIEFLHRDQYSLVNQREVAVDTRSFAQALRSALRQDPDVILVGEMRDFETIETAVPTAETGRQALEPLDPLGLERRRVQAQGAGHLDDDRNDARGNVAHAVESRHRQIWWIGPRPTSTPSICSPAVNCRSNRRAAVCSIATMPPNRSTRPSR